jgi:hypothetical protein
MTVFVAERGHDPVLQLDTAFLRRIFAVFAGFGVLLAPLSHDPIAMVVGAAMPLILMTLLDKPAMPSALIFFVLWQWIQVFTRVLLAMTDGEPLSAGMYGADVTKAYWYSLACLTVIAVAFRIALDGVPRPSQADRLQHLTWQPSMLFAVYVGTWLISLGLQQVTALSPGLAQPLAAVGQFKTVIVFMLFVVAMTTGRGLNWSVGVFLVEIVTGFSGFFSSFKDVFFVLAFAAVAVRISLTPASIVISVFSATMLLILALFWTAVKPEYRSVVSGGTNVQAVQIPISERVSWLGGKALSPGDIPWGEALDAFFRRVAYIDFFGASIGVAETAVETEKFQRWGDALGHVFRPRILFPDKPVLDDTEVFDLLARGEVAAETRSSTSISVGYMAENYVDFRFPGMLVSIFAMGLLMGYVARYFMTRPIAWMTREALMTGLVLTLITGVEMSLSKFLGATILVSLVLALSTRFIYPIIVRWIRQ